MYTEGLGDTVYDSGSEQERDGGFPYVPAIQSPLNAQDFEYYWGDELLVLYHQLKDSCSQYGFALFENLDFCTFCKFAYDQSSKRKPPC